MYPSRWLLIAGILVATNGPAWTQDPDKGRVEFLSQCAECHGADGKGAGPKSSKLKIKPDDLTLLARKNGGVFSPDAVAAAIDGRNATRSHRSSEMPIWGCRHGPPPGSQGKAYQPKPIDALLDIPCDPERDTRSRIQDVVEYLRRIQAK